MKVCERFVKDGAKDGVKDGVKDGEGSSFQVDLRSKRSNTKTVEESDWVTFQHQVQHSYHLSMYLLEFRPT